MKKAFLIFLTVILVSSAFVGCKSSTSSSDNEDNQTASSKELNIYMWQQYISDDLISKFEKLNGMRIG